jgi:hypothetical protein
MLGRYMATGFQTYKQINNRCNCERVSVGVFSWKNVRKKKKSSFEVPDSNLVGCGTVSTGKNDFPQGNNIVYIFRFEQWKEL